MNQNVPMALQAVIFDMDGTLIDSEGLWVDAIAAALRQRGAAVTEDDAVRLVYGHSWPDIFRRIEVLFPGLYATRQAMEAVTVPLFQEYCRQRDIRIEPSIALLRRLAACLPTMIVSGSTRARVEETIAALDLAGCLRGYVGAEDVTAGKPDPQGFLLAARHLGVPPASCLVFEDSTAGVRAAKAAGMRCVALRRAQAAVQDFNTADEVLTSLADFSPERWGMPAC
ncbi:MAG: HAD family phosphatase [Lentisphaerae bacterium]|nr:HAD family phosphatase [Lentisphaerota bacterium]